MLDGTTRGVDEASGAFGGLKQRGKNVLSGFGSFANELNRRKKTVVGVIGVLATAVLSCASPPAQAYAGPPELRPDPDSSTPPATLVAPADNHLSPPMAAVLQASPTPPPPEASPTPFPQPYEITGNFHTQFKGIGGPENGNGLVFGPQIWGLDSKTFPTEVGNNPVTALKYAVAHTLDRVKNVPSSDPYHLRPPAFSLLPTDEGRPPSESNSQPMRLAILQTQEGINTGSGEIQPQAYIQLVGYDGSGGKVLTAVTNQKNGALDTEFKWVDLKGLEQFTNAAGIKGRVEVYTGYYGYLYVAIDGKAYPLNTFGDQSIIDQINQDIAQTKAKKATPIPPTQVPPTNTPQPTNTPNPPEATNTPVPPEQPKAAWWTTEEGREEWIRTVLITDEQPNPDGIPSDRDLLREYVGYLVEYQNNSPSAIDPMFSSISYPKAADPNPVMALLSKNNLKKISMHGAGSQFFDSTQKRVELDIDAPSGYSLTARKIINAAALAKEAWAIKWSSVEYKTTGMTQDEVNALTKKIDKRSHSLLLSVIKYWSERHPDEGVRSELNWYYTKWIEINSLTQLTKPRTNEEFASALQNLYSYRSDSLANGAQPNDLDIRKEMVKLQNQIVSARSPKAASRLRLELQALQNSIRT